MDLQIKNVDDLRAEIYRLKMLEAQQGQAIRERVSSPSAIFSTLLSIFPKSPPNPDGSKPGLLHLDFVQLFSSFLLPFTLNKTLFRKSNFLIKGLVTMVTRRASRFINEESVTNLWDKVKSFVPDKLAGLFHGKEKEPKFVPPGVPAQN